MKTGFPVYPKEIIEYYTEGQCWSLAWHLSNLADLPLVTVGPRGDMWYHVVVKKSPRRHLDIEGIHTKSRVKAFWGSGYRELGRFASLEDYMIRLLGEDYEETRAHFQDPFEARTNKIAKEILACVS